MRLAESVVMMRRCAALFVACLAFYGVGCGPPPDYTELDIQVVIDDDGVHARSKDTVDTDLDTATVWAGGSDTLEIEIF